MSNPPSTPTSANLEIEPQESKDVGACPCCKSATRTVWGFVYRDGAAHACYFVQWTLGHHERGARIDVVIGDWNPGAPEDALHAVSLQAKFHGGSPSFELADARGRPAGEMGQPLAATDVGDDLAHEARTIAIEVVARDTRLGALRMASG